MHHHSKITDLYQGFLSTPFLWTKKPLNKLSQLQLPVHKATHNYEGILPSNIRLGKIVERFVSHELNQYESINILRENLQIIENKITLGEIDCLLKLKEQFIHLEIVYKFYLYDPDNSSEEIDRWIGPNRKDSLLQKLTKLKEKQLPILFHKQTKLHLEKLQIKLAEIKQKTYFKAQLFVPLNLVNKKFLLVNNQCIKGFYIRLKELYLLNENTFYIPSKIDWLLEPNSEDNWLSYTDFEPQVTQHLNNERSPLCWVKDKKGNTGKFFVVWWD